MADPVLRLGKGNTKVLFLCHFTRNLKSVVFVRITRRGGGGELVRIHIPDRFKSSRPVWVREWV